jgi:hypothetical protein
MLDHRCHAWRTPRVRSSAGHAGATRSWGGSEGAGSPLRQNTYPFTDPAVSPCTMYFWNSNTSSTAGSAPRKPEAAITE